MKKLLLSLKNMPDFDSNGAFCISKDDSFPRYNNVYLTKSGQAIIENVPECNNGSINIGSFISSMILHVLSISTIVETKEDGWHLENKGINLLDISTLLSTGIYHGFSVSVVPQMLEEYNKDSFECIFKLSDKVYMAILKSKPDEVIFIKSRLENMPKQDYNNDCYCDENIKAKEND